jgi:adenylate kinase family enzyme
MRVFFCGAQGTGKSTLVQLLAKQLPQMIVHDSMSALFMKNKDEQFTDTFQNRVNVYCWNIFLNSENNIIMSRSIIDSLALNIKQKDLIYINSIISDCIRKNDFYFYLPIEFEISQREDGLRELDPEYQFAVDKVIYRTFNDFPAENKYVLRGSIEERLEQILKVI